MTQIIRGPEDRCPCTICSLGRLSKQQHSSKRSPLININRQRFLRSCVWVSLSPHHAQITTTCAGSAQSMGDHLRTLLRSYILQRGHISLGLYFHRCDFGRFSVSTRRQMVQKLYTSMALTMAALVSPDSNIHEQERYLTHGYSESIL